MTSGKDSLCEKKLALVLPRSITQSKTSSRLGHKNWLKCVLASVARDFNVSAFL